MSLKTRLKKIEQPFHDSWEKEWHDFQYFVANEVLDANFIDVVEHLKQWKLNEGKDAVLKIPDELNDEFIAMIGADIENEYQKWIKQVIEIQNKLGGHYLSRPKKINLSNRPVNLICPTVEIPHKALEWIVAKCKEDTCDDALRYLLMLEYQYYMMARAIYLFHKERNLI